MPNITVSESAIATAESPVAGQIVPLLTYNPYAHASEIVGCVVGQTAVVHIAPGPAYAVLHDRNQNLVAMPTANDSDGFPSSRSVVWIDPTTVGTVS